MISNSPARWTLFCLAWQEVDLDSARKMQIQPYPADWFQVNLRTRDTEFANVCLSQYV